jgi:AraC-like DNA-binding protein
VTAAARTGVAAADVRIAPLMGLPAVLEHFGVDPQSLLGEFGIDPDAFRNPENRIAYARVGRLFGRCAQVTSCEHFGLLVGERAGITSLGAVGYLALSAQDVYSALRILQQRYHLADGGGTITLERVGRHVSFGYEIVEPGVENADQLVLAAVAIGFNIVRTLCGPQWAASDVQLSMHAPRDTTSIRRFFNLAPRFDQERSCVTFATHWLTQPPPGADPLLHLMMRERVAELTAAASSSSSVAGQVRRLLRTTITTTGCSLESAAAQLRMSDRTLKRRLAVEAVTFLQLRDEARYNAACQMLRHTRMPAGQISSILGYADCSAFTRAFTRWSGISPTAWRNRKPRPGRRRNTAVARPARQ